MASQRGPPGGPELMCVPPYCQDGILLGAVGAYDWNGAVLKETSGGKVIPLRESYLKEFPEELKNHGAYLGESQRRAAAGQWARRGPRSHTAHP